MAPNTSRILGSSSLLCDRSTQLKVSHSVKCSMSSTVVSLLWDMYSEFNFGMRAEKEENVES